MTVRPGTPLDELGTSASRLLPLAGKVALGARAERALGRIRLVNGDVLAFSSEHIRRVLGAERWLVLESRPNSSGRVIGMWTFWATARPTVLQPKLGFQPDQVVAAAGGQVRDR